MLDRCVWGGALPLLKEAGYDVVWTGEWETDPGDQAILHQVQLVPKLPLGDAPPEALASRL